MTLVDTTIEHRPASGVSSAVTFIYSERFANDLGALAGGVLHQRLEVMSKPSDAPVHYQLCLVPQDISVRPACSDGAQLAFTSEGTYEATQSISSLSGAAEVAWGSGLQSLMVVLRHPDGSPIDDGFLAQQGARAELDDYFPMVVRFQAVAVPQGSTFTGWP